MSNVPNAWEDDWSAAADTSAPGEATEAKKVSTKVTKAQRRAQQAEFNRRLWAEAEGPRDTNYFLESRNVVPLRSEYKAPPVLLSRKAPKVHTRSPRPPADGIQNLNLNGDQTVSTADQESSEDEEEVQARELTLAERQAQAAKEREEKQRRYEERRKELFGNSNISTAPSSQKQGVLNKSGNSSPGSLTPPGSRSATPNRARGGRGGRRGGALGDPNMTSRHQSRGGSQQRELFDHSYDPKPDSTYTQRRERENGNSTLNNAAGGSQNQVQHPIRTPKGPDGSFGFVQKTKPVHAESQLNANAEIFNSEAFVPSDMRATS